MGEPGQQDQMQQLERALQAVAHGPSGDDRELAEGWSEHVRCSCDPEKEAVRLQWAVSRLRLQGYLRDGPPGRPVQLSSSSPTGISADDNGTNGTALLSMTGAVAGNILLKSLRRKPGLGTRDAGAAASFRKDPVRRSYTRGGRIEDVLGPKAQTVEQIEANLFTTSVLDGPNHEGYLSQATSAGVNGHQRGTSSSCGASVSATEATGELNTKKQGKNKI